MNNPARSLGRKMLASMFVMGGMDAVRHPERVADQARSVTEPLGEALADVTPALQDAETANLVRANGAAQVAAGSLLAMNRLPRLSSLVLAGTLVPTTLAGHRFWEAEDPGVRTQQRIAFTKNVSMLGGLVLAALDTEGRPGLAWRASHAKEHAELAADHTRKQARLARRAAKSEARAVKAETRKRAERLRRRAVPDVVDLGRAARSALAS